MDAPTPELVARALARDPAACRRLVDALTPAIQSRVNGALDRRRRSGIKNLDVTGDQLKKCKAPILFVHGSKEANATKERAAVIIKLLGRGEIKVIEGADHMTTLTNPEFGKTIGEFPIPSRCYAAEDSSTSAQARGLDKAQAGYSHRKGLRGRKDYPHHAGLPVGEPVEHWLRETAASVTETTVSLHHTLGALHRAMAQNHASRGEGLSRRR